MNALNSPCRPVRFSTSYCVAGLLFIFIIGRSVSSWAQAYFYFENKVIYPNDSSTTYYTLLTLYNNGSGIARVRYKDARSKESRLFEINMIDSAGADRSQRRFLVQQSEALPVQGVADSSFFSPKFVFQRNEEGGEVFFEPSAMTYKWPDGTFHFSEMLANQQKTRADLRSNPDLVTFFYSEEDEFYLSLFLMRASNTQYSRKEKLHLIAVVNTLDSTLGNSTTRDLSNILGLFTRIAKGLNMEIIVQKIADQDFSKMAVELALVKLKPAPIDIVIFYYSGHGFRYSNDASLYPRMSLRTNARSDIDKNNLSVEGVYKALLRKKARVTLVLSDCCNEDIGSPVPMVEEFLRVKSPPGRPPLNIGLCNALFFPKKTVGILVGSADKNQLAVCTDRLGGYFTNSFTVELEKKLYEPIAGQSTWRSILAASRQNAFNLSLGADCNRLEKTATSKPEPCVQMARFAVSQ